MLKVAVAFCCVIWFVGGSAAATDAASPTWIGKRVNMWIKLCPATAPSFAGFATAVRKNGFRPNRNGMFNYKETEIVASLKKTAKGCACKFSFGTDSPNLAGSMVAKAMVSQFKSRFQPDDNPRSLGELATADGKLPVTAKSWKAYGGDWIGLIIHGKRSCPSH